MTTATPPFDVAFIKTLFEFNFWENRRVWDLAIMPLTEAQFTQDTGYSWGTLQRECVHVMDGECNWLKRAQSQQPQSLEFADYPTRERCRARWDTIEQDWQVFLTTLDESTFFGPARFQFRGKEATRPRWQILFHVLNHGTLHRAEMLKMVAEISGPVDFDLSMMQYLTGVFRP